MLLALVAALVKEDAAIAIPAIAIAGIPVCWRWKMPGLIAAIVVLLTLLAVSFPAIESHERVWHVGMTLAAALSLVVTTLCIEEVESMASGVAVESSSRLQHLNKTDERLKETQRAWQDDRRKLVEQLQALTHEVEEKRTRIATFQRVISIVRKDQEVAHDQRVALTGQIAERDAVIRQLKHDVTTGSSSRPIAPVSGRGSADLDRSLRRVEGKYRQLREQFEEKQSVLETTRRELFETQERCLGYEHAAAEEQTHSLGECELVLERYMLQSERELARDDEDAQAEIDALHQLVASLLNELATAEAQPGSAAR
jgi:septal ring factor EnvC (AmiA/AmiB activator)